MAPTFVFNSVSLSSLNSTSDYYLQAVTTNPSPTLVTIADLGSTTISTPQILTGTTYIGGVLNFPDQIFNTRTFIATHVGFVLAQRIGVNFSSSDPLIAYTPHTNSLGQELIMPIGTYAIPMDFATTGLFAVLSAWRYSAGNYINNGATYYNNGIVQLIGTKNGTTAYVNPTTGTVPNIETLPNSPNLFARTAAIALTTANSAAMMRFRGDGDICFNAGARVAWSGSVGSAAFRLFGSNILSQGWTAPAIFDNSNWTELINLGGGVGGVSNTFSSNGIFYRYLKIAHLGVNVVNDNFFGNVDFYNCTVRTTYQDFN